MAYVKKENPKNKGGRPTKKIDRNIFEGMCRIQCTQQEMCDIFECDENTINAWCKRTYNMGFSEVFRQKRGQGKVSLRRMQWKACEAGNTSMLIWLGKNLLGQTDKQEIAQTTNSSPITINVQPATIEDVEDDY